MQPDCSWLARAERSGIVQSDQAQLLQLDGDLDLSSLCLARVLAKELLRSLLQTSAMRMAGILRSPRQIWSSDER